jgi:phospholipase C
MGTACCNSTGILIKYPMIVWNVIVVIFNNMWNVFSSGQQYQNPNPNHVNHLPQIKHVIHLVLENRSYDHIMGGLPGGNGASPNNTNLTKEGKVVAQYPFSDITEHLAMDPPHYFPDAQNQMANGNSGFVKIYEEANPDAKFEKVRQIMGYYPFGMLKGLHSLAANFTVCDNWFCSVPGSTDPNREFIIAGTSCGKVLNQEIDDGNNYNQDTIFNVMTEKRGASWKLYAGDLASALTNRKAAKQAASMYRLEQFYEDAAKGDLPFYSYIEPYYYFHENDMHPNQDIRIGDKFASDIYLAVRSNPELWKHALLIITFDENGGQYDHVTPPVAIPPDNNVKNYAFNQYGVRVPTLIIGPHVKHTVDHTLYDHTSMLKFLCNILDYDPSIFGNRTAQANSFEGELLSDAELTPELLNRLPSIPAYDYVPRPFADMFLVGIIGWMLKWIVITRCWWLRKWAPKISTPSPQPVPPVSAELNDSVGLQEIAVEN